MDRNNRRRLKELKKSNRSDVRIRSIPRKGKKSGGEQVDPSPAPEFTVKYVQSEFSSKSTFRQKFKAQKDIGLGGQAKIKQAIDLETREAVALKIFKKSKMTFIAL